MKKIIFLLVAVLLSIQCSEAARVDTAGVYSASMKKIVKAVIVLPEGYADKSTKYPVIYLLHGLSDNYGTWITKVPSIKNLSDEFKVILVCPDGDYGSWYLDSPFRKDSQYETFISKELIANIDSHYRTIPNKHGRAITGLSMGGHGALYNASRNPSVFGSAGSMSGALNLVHMATGGASLVWIKDEIEKRLGPYETNKEIWQGNSVVDMIDLLRAAHLNLVIDCGVDDYLIEDNRQLHQKMIVAKVKHRYIENPGAHNWEYWLLEVREQVYFLNRFFKR